MRTLVVYCKYLTNLYFTEDGALIHKKRTKRWHHYYIIRKYRGIIGQQEKLYLLSDPLYFICLPQALGWLLPLKQSRVLSKRSLA